MEPPRNRTLLPIAGRRTPLVGVVGPCGSGKSTLIAGLEKHGYRCRHIAQEHSYVQAMWQIIAKPDVLIYLAASFPISTARRQLNWQKKDHDKQLQRLAHARQHAGLVVNTDMLTPEQVLQRVLDYLLSAAAAEHDSPASF
jgi:cytidylate kinase